MLLSSVKVKYGLILIGLLGGMGRPAGAQGPLSLRPGGPEEGLSIGLLQLGPPLAGEEELARIARDILLLRALNDLGLSREQIRQALPPLKEWLAAQRRFREGVKRWLLSQRARLLKGNPSAVERNRASQEMDTLRKRYREAIEAARRKITEVLGQEKGGGLIRLVRGGFTRELRPSFPLGPRPPRGRLPRPGTSRIRPPGPPPGPPPSRLPRPDRPEPPAAPGWTRPQWLPFGPPEAVLPRLIALLEEKLKAMK